ncbi:transposase [Chryseobacterium sp. PBS4-4]|uniref:Transposase n=1 Tax=Chryseobacterium edaphi TaxID=2976532 RepID=A0ABT2WAY6_9FLAO|nr:transposase [Chryseobacterium edaphi]MCU7618437.1 transposase [Chryseobacterium edaphi]
MKDFKNIDIGNIIKKRVAECQIDISRICKFLNTTEEEINRMYESEDLNSNVLLRWSKLLEYDFFRIYSQHLILYSPPTRCYNNIQKTQSSAIPSFKKHIYTTEIIHFVLEQIATGQKTKIQVIEDYRIPKTTLYKWIEKYADKK